MPLGFKTIWTAHITVQGGTDGQGKVLHAIPGHILPQSQPLAFINLLVHKEPHRAQLFNTFLVGVTQVPGIILCFFEQVLFFPSRRHKAVENVLNSNAVPFGYVSTIRLYLDGFTFSIKHILLSFYVSTAPVPA